MEDVLLLKLLGKRSVYDFVLKAEKVQEEAGFIMEQSFFFLTISVVRNKQIQSIIIP